MTYFVGQIVAAPCERVERALNLSGGVLDQHRALTWYLARAVTRQEKRAEASLSNVGVAHYFPRLTDWERRGRDRHRVRVQSSLFGGYGFIGLTGDQSAYGLPRLEGFIGAVWMAKDCRPRGVPLGMIEKIVRQELNGDFDYTSNCSALAEQQAFERDEIVRVVDGFFAGFNGALLRVPEKKRVEVLVSVFGRMTRVELPLSAIEKIG